jgi:hypothetical protein
MVEYGRLLKERSVRPLLPVWLMLTALTAAPVTGDLSATAGQALPISGESDISTPLYTPPKNLSPRARIGGSLRGTEGHDPELQAIVPDHVGFTVKSTPTLNWFLSKPTAQKITFTLTNTESIKPLYEGALPGPAKEGFHSIDLKALGLTLEPDVQYRWHVAVERDPDSRSKDIVAGGIIERCEFTACLAEVQPNLTCTQQSVVDNMRGGLWYDAMGCLCHLIDVHPTDPSLRRLRAHLLKQVGLHGVAEWDLRSVQTSTR